MVTEFSWDDRSRWFLHQNSERKQGKNDAGWCASNPTSFAQARRRRRKIVTNIVRLSVTEVTLARRETNRRRWILQSSEQHC